MHLDNAVVAQNIVEPVVYNILNSSHSFVLFCMDKYCLVPPYTHTHKPHKFPIIDPLSYSVLQVKFLSSCFQLVISIFREALY